jgi:ribonucleoside-diphosphate reductase beta chain
MVQREPRFADTIQRVLAEVAPAADGVLRPKWFDGSDDDPVLFGRSVSETRAFAMQALTRRLKAIELAVESPA